MNFCAWSASSIPRTRLVKNGFWMSGMTTPMVLVARARRLRAT